jgi:hypothetical protein
MPLSKAQKCKELAINALWYIFIAICVGQAPIIYNVTQAFLKTGTIESTITTQTINGNFLNFSIALLASSCYHIIHEYNSDQKINSRKSKSLIALIVIVCIALSLAILQSFNPTATETTTWQTY